MIQVDDLSRSLIAFEQISTLVIVVELSQSSWLAAGVVPGIERRPLKKLDPDPTALLHLVEGWRGRATKAGRAITRTVLAFESGRDGFWLARWLRVRGVETFVMHSTSVAVSREPRRAKTDRLDTEMLIRVFLGWLRGEPRHCKMVAIPTLEEEDARRPSRERETLVGERTRIINRMMAALARLGIRGFKPGLLTAPQKLDALRTPEETPIPPKALSRPRLLLVNRARRPLADTSKINNLHVRQSDRNCLKRALLGDRDGVDGARAASGSMKGRAK